eukprot:Hpha_TRINITY_DN15240_c2_g1::TRINITY_DN15240_c2_g1_i1::g.66129::m.66129
MIFAYPPDFGDPQQAYEDARQVHRSQDRASDAQARRRHGSRHARSLSPPTEEELAAIQAEVNRQADQKPPASARTKDVEGKGKVKKEGEDQAGAGEDKSAESDFRLVADPDWVTHATLPPPKLSCLTADVKSGRGRGPVHGRQRLLKLKVYCPFVTPPGSKVKMCPIQVVETATVVDVIRQTLRALQDDTADPVPYSLNPDHYRLRVAEDDTGKPDDDLPVFDKKSALRNIGFDMLVLCPTQPFRGTEPGAAPGLRPNMPPSLEDATVRIVRTKKRFTQLLIPPDVVFKDALQVVCDHFKKDHQKYTLRLFVDGQEKDALPEDAVSVNLADRTVGTITRVYGIKEFVLKAKSRDVVESDGSDTETGGGLTPFCDWDEATASRYTEYDVVKINKYNSRQDRKLGIDRDKIYNMMRGVKPEKTKNPERSISDVQKVHWNPDRPCYFEIDYRPGVCKSGRDQIECASAHEAHEIVTKVKFLLSRVHDLQRKEPPTKEEGDKKITLPTGVSRFLGGLLPGGGPTIHSPRGDPK